MNNTLTTLITSATQALQHAYAPYSGYQVGASIRCEHGHIFSGANIENPAYGLTLCAEATAIATMIMAGCREIKELVLINNSAKYCTPCGACRQRIREFAMEDALIHCCDFSGIQKTFTLGALLPEAFSANNLK